MDHEGREEHKEPDGGLSDLPASDAKRAEPFFVGVLRALRFARHDMAGADQKDLTQTRRDAESVRPAIGSPPILRLLFFASPRLRVTHPRPANSAES